MQEHKLPECVAGQLPFYHSGAVYDFWKVVALNAQPKQTEILQVLSGYGYRYI